jgi:hypothetical protein
MLGGTLGMPIAALQAEGNSKMKTRQLTKKIGTAILGLSVMAGIGFAGSTTTQAQTPWRQYQRDRDNQDRNNQDRNRDNRRGRGRRSNDDYPNWGGSFQLRQTALNAGYNEGIKEGRKDRNRRRHNINEFNAYQKATKDYNSRDGDRELYRRYFREAFQNGYDAGYNGY